MIYLSIVSFYVVWLCSFYFTFLFFSLILYTYINVCGCMYEYIDILFLFTSMISDCDVTAFTKNEEREEIKCVSRIEDELP